MIIGTIDGTVEMNFLEALQELNSGKCIGIRPQGNSKFLMQFKHSSNENDNSNWAKSLCWSRSFVSKSDVNTIINIEQFLSEKWVAVYVDCNDLPQKILDLFILQNITSTVKHIEEFNNK